MAKLQFYDLKTRKKFESDKFELETRETTKGMRYIAIATTPSGIKAFRYLSKDMYEELEEEGY